LLLNSLSTKNNCFLNANIELEIGNDYALVNGLESVTIYAIEGKVLGKFVLRDYFQNGKILIPIQKPVRGIYLAQLKGLSIA
jgi:hypothetical protein